MVEIIGVCCRWESTVRCRRNGVTARLERQGNTSLRHRAKTSIMAGAGLAGVGDSILDDQVLGLFFDFLIRHLECGGGYLSGAVPGELVNSPTSVALFELLDEACCEL